MSDTIWLCSGELAQVTPFHALLWYGASVLVRGCKSEELQCLQRPLYSPQQLDSPARTASMPDPMALMRFMRSQRIPRPSLKSL